MLMYMLVRFWLDQLSGRRLSSRGRRLSRSGVKTAVASLRIDAMPWDETEGREMMKNTCEIRVCLSVSPIFQRALDPRLIDSWFLSLVVPADPSMPT